MRALVLIALSLLALPAVGREAVPRKIAVGGDCRMQENINISVSFNFRADSFVDAKAEFDQKMKQVEDFAKQQKIEKFEVQSMNYNINTQNYHGADAEYQMNGSVNYQLTSSDDAFKLGEFLTQQKFQVNVSANSHRQGNCN